MAIPRRHRQHPCTAAVGTQSPGTPCGADKFTRSQGAWQPAVTIWSGAASPTPVRRVIAAMEREREDRAGSGLTCRGGESRPAAPGFRGAKARGQNRPAGGGPILRWSFSQGQLELGKLLADRIGHPHQVIRFPVAGRRQLAAGDANRGQGRRAPWADTRPSQQPAWAATRPKILPARLPVIGAASAAGPCRRARRGPRGTQLAERARPSRMTTGQVEREQRNSRSSGLPTIPLPGFTFLTAWRRARPAYVAEPPRQHLPRRPPGAPGAAVPHRRVSASRTATPPAEP
jgi:hypothetical protein